VSGGEIGLIGDLSQNLSISFPPLSREGYDELRRRLPPFTAVSNPLDGWGSGDLVETYPACLEVLAKERDIDLIIVSQDSPPGMAEKQVTQYADVARAAVKTAVVGKPVVAMSHVSGGLDQTIKGILDDGNVPFLQGTREGLVAIHHLVEYSRFLKRGRTVETPAGKSPKTLPEIVESLKGKRRVLGDDKAKKILQAYGIDIVKEVLVQSGNEALKAAKRIGYPVALKGLSPHIPHKTEAGLVRLNVRNGEELNAGYAQIQNNAKAFDPNAELEGILIQEMVPSDAAEILVGMTRDPSFGPVVVLGLGGIWVELLADTALRLPPINSDDALEMISELKGKQLLEGFRGRPCVDVKSLAAVLVQVGRMAVDLKEVLISLDLNPLMVLPGEGGSRVIDVVMEVGNT